MKKRIYFEFIALVIMGFIIAGLTGATTYKIAKDHGFLVMQDENLELAISNTRCDVMEIKEQADTKLNDRKSEIEAEISDNWVDVAISEGYLLTAPSQYSEKQAYDKFINKYLAARMNNWYNTAFAGNEKAEAYEIYVMDSSRNLLWQQNSRWDNDADKAKRELTPVINNSYEQGYKDGEYTYFYTMTIGSSRYNVVMIKSITPEMKRSYSKTVVWSLILSFIVFLIVVSIGIYGKIRYIQDIAYSARRISDGEVDVMIQRKGNDELTAVAVNLNEMNHTLNASIEKERQNAKDTRTLMTNLSHDLKTPLTLMSGYLDVAQSTDSEEERKVYIEKAAEYTGRLQTMIHNMLEAFKNQVDIEKFSVMNLSLFLEQMIYEYEDDEKKFDLEADKNIEFSYDAKSMQTLVYNLLDNALKYRKGEKPVKVSLKESDEEICLDVSNESEPLENDAIEHLFDEFYRSDKSRNSKTEGNGLGLFIVKNIVKNHKGTVNADFSEGIFTVHVRFPKEH